MQLVIRLVINAVALWLAAAWVSGIEILSPAEDGTGARIVVVLVIAAVFTLVNALVKPVVKLLSLPLILLTLGLFLLVINALMLWLTAKLTELADTNGYGLEVNGFWAAVFGGIIVSLVNWVLGALVPDND
ncbi:phage holin family protein [Nocardia farcinica]|uniref:phage holin family protein n=1 Tax=Nocardia farcinica TaxID=37329 RepID=UPI00189397A1|nr:phage holin family protein [Nocardia farcinica]MBF6141129.1 phage holin family protein [Nocardia farcinica]MBF6254742.1 phage holin family protein [Nocardia farcinica]MBF6292754.1 phage holin family protein [Nocardia farcinica]MBF6363242.1 phage holin family protein [Nocardia farcinica]MBF6373671.1 phage holin family protein [Nocardia farcinica]